MDPKIIGAFGVLCLCSISSSSVMMMGSGEEKPVVPDTTTDDSGSDDSGADDSGADDSGADDSEATTTPTPPAAPTGWPHVSWSKIPGGLKQVDIDGNTVCGVNSADNIYCKDDLTSGNWKKLPGALKYVSVTGGNKLYGANSADDIYFGTKP